MASQDKQNIFSQNNFRVQYTLYIIRFWLLVMRGNGNLIWQAWITAS